MKVILINPPITTNLETASILGLKAPPLGLAYIGAVLEKEGYNVKIIDAAALDISNKKLGEILKKESPNVIGVTSTTPTVYDAMKAIITAKENVPDAITIMGGYHITFLPEETMMECPALDIGVIGEGEVTIIDLLKSLEGKKPISEVDGIVYRKEGKIIRNKPRKLIENLDEIPFPARHLLPLDKYTVLGESKRLGNIMTSRGCPFNCIFCSSSKFYGRKFRARSPKNVVDEIEELFYKYKIKSIEIVDDVFTINKNRALEIAKEIIKRGLDIWWACGARVDLVTKELLSIFKRAGCEVIYYGIESGSERILKILKKGITLEQAKKAVKWAKEVGIEVVGSFIIGTPGETKEDVMKTIKFAKDCDIDFAQFTAMTPYPGTEIYEIAEREGLLLTRDWSKYTTIVPVMRTKELSAKDICSLIEKAYRMFYLRPAFFLKQLIKGRFKWIIPILRNYLASYF
ncbi:MAG: B12-binding domain-containing radical SAM protein [Candidatus Methanomethyliaceae archaeon]|nr:B12-binding domain-containing radical SAM protein [Candidatus Methanomethyliaceae archaeon]MDW7971539.1 radical SAM protein [Nitrososphaerota archaeon]